MDRIGKALPEPSAPLRMAQRERFAQVLAAGGVTQAGAYRQAYPVSVKWKDSAVDSKASQLMTALEVRARVEWLQRQAGERTIITKAQALDIVLEKWVAVATADPSEITRWRHLNCRHCHGVDHKFRWKNLREYATALADASDAQRAWDDAPPDKRRGKRPELPNDEGGYGWRRTDDPSADCPECEGEGVEDAKLGDTRKLSKSARVLFDGVKQTKNGVEVKTLDRMAALAGLAKYAGVTDVVDVRGGLAVAAVVAAVTPEQSAAIAKKLLDEY